jgi:hypothetical protein
MMTNYCLLTSKLLILNGGEIKVHVNADRDKQMGEIRCLLSRHQSGSNGNFCSCRHKGHSVKTIATSHKKAQINNERKTYQTPGR